VSCCFVICFGLFFGLGADVVRLNGEGLFIEGEKGGVIGEEGCDGARKEGPSGENVKRAEP